MSNLAALLERVKAATGPDRELDADIYEALCFKIKRADLTCRGARSWCFYENSRWVPMGRLTASMEASVALIERCLPKATWRLGFTDIPDPEAGELERFFARVKGPRFHHAPTAPLALLAALLTALLA